MTPEFLGYQRTDAGWRPVWVIWLGDPTQGIAAQLPGEFICGHCRSGRSLAALQRWADLDAPVVRSVSVSCACRASVHFDTTPVAERAQLSWTQRFAPRLPAGVSEPMEQKA